MDHDNNTVTGLLPGECAHPGCLWLMWVPQETFLSRDSKSILCHKAVNSLSF